MAIIINKWLKG